LTQNIADHVCSIVTRSTARLAGTVFEGPDGTRFIVASAETRQEAEAAKASAVRKAIVLAICPSWSFPAAEWIAANPPFWRPSSAAKRD
jgi:hypothetical protein